MFKDQVAIITGSSQGIGEAIANFLSNQGASVVINYPFKSDQEKADLVAKRINDNGGKAIAFQANVTNENEIKQMIDHTVNIFNGLNILVNNAGITIDSTVKNMSVESFKTVLDTNLVGTFITSKIAAELMAHEGYGRIINIASIAGQTGSFGQANYAASKAGVIGLTKTFALEYAKKGVTVNAISPGFIKTSMTNAIPEHIRMKMIDEIPVNRPGEPVDIVAAVSFLASKNSGFITGQQIAVNGGQYM